MVTLQSIAKRETNAEMEAPNFEFEVNPFGLREEANGWIQTELISLGEDLYLFPANRYRPLVMFNDSVIPAARFHKAAAEYKKRSCSSKKFRPDLVAIGVNDRTMRLFVNGEEGLLKRAR